MSASESIVPLRIGEKPIVPDTTNFNEVFNPSKAEVIALTPMCGPKEVDLAVQVAAKAYRDWSTTPATKRSAILFRFKQLLEQELESLTRLITLENGKTYAEAKGDVRRGIEVVDFACGIAQLTKGENLPRIADNLDGETMREPIGVCAGITPFNFPAMVPMWMFPLAIACGNTFVLKPSEKVPLTANRLAELFLEAGLPSGVFNVVHGGREVVDALCAHPLITALSFVGSTKIARHVYERGCLHGKRVQAAGGAKNVLVVMPDAQNDATTRAIIGSAYGCAGQRCMAGSLLIGVGKHTLDVREAVVKSIDELVVDDTTTNRDAGMGPIIDGASRKRIQDFVGRTLAGGGVNALRDGSGQMPATGFFLRPVLLDGVTPEAEIFQHEIFGPVLAMMHATNLDEAINWTKLIPYGNGATIFTQSGYAARRFSQEVPCGMIGVNVGVPAPMSQFAFSGWNQSFFGDLHVQGNEGVMFFTRQKVTLSRWDDTYVRNEGW